MGRSLAALRAGDLEGLGRLLFASHRSSRTWFENSSPELDFLVDSLEVNFKGGQVGAEDYFGAVARGKLYIHYSNRLICWPSCSVTRVMFAIV